MSTLIFTGDRNAEGKKDFTGAFRPEAQKFAKAYSGESQIVRIDLSRPKHRMRDAVLEAIRGHEMSTPIGCLAFFCHGYRTGIQLGFKLTGKGRQGTEELDDLADALAQVGTNDIRVLLYACHAARDADNDVRDDQRAGPGGDGGFADELRDALCRAGSTECRVMAHTTAGHTTRNPHVRFFDGSGESDGGTGGYWVYRPWGPRWKKWIAFLKKSDNRFTFPFVSDVSDLRAMV